MFLFWLYSEYHLTTDGHIFDGFFGPIVEWFATLVFTALAVLLCRSVQKSDAGSSGEVTPVDGDKEKHWAIRGMWVFAFFAILACAQINEVVIVGLIQALIFYLPFFIQRKPWKHFAIRDIMISTMLACCGLGFFVNLPIHFWRVWQSLLVVGIAGGVFNLLAHWLVNSKRVKTKWMCAIAIPYIALLTIILSLEPIKRGTPNLIRRLLTAFVFLPILLAIGVLLLSRPKPVEIGSGKNAIHEIISIGDEIGNIYADAPPYPKNGPTLRPFPKTIAEMKNATEAYSPMTNKVRDLSDQPTWLLVNYDWKDSQDYKNRCKELNALSNLTTVMLVEGQLAFLENRVADGLERFTDAMNLNRQCGSGGLPASTLAAMDRDHYMIEKFADFQKRLTPEQAISFATRLLEQCDAYEHYSVLMERRFAWEDRVPNWHQRLALKHLARTYQGKLHPAIRGLSRTRFHQMKLRLLAMQLLILAHETSHGELPKSLEEILPEQFAPLNYDPYSVSRSPFIYRQSDGTFVLFSVGSNGVDNGGEHDDFTLDSARKMHSWAD